MKKHFFNCIIMHRDYQALISRLYYLANISRKEKLTLQNIESLYRELNCPAKNIPMVHIGGTNGKGSVANKMAKGLFDAGYNTALFTSPHISTFRERIQINFQMISKDEFIDLICPLFEIIDEKNLKIHFFEILTILALQYFEVKKVDIAIIEVGLGGRLDATNIITSILSIIVSIGLDHCHILGDTLDEIAFEKGGIIKPNVPLLVGPNANFSPIIEAAKNNNCAYHIVQGDFSTFDEQNQCIAKCGLEMIARDFPINSSIINRAVLSKPPCRIEEINYKNKKVILDVAHNVFGLLELKKVLNKKYPNQKFEIYLSLSKDKDIENFCKQLIFLAHKVHLIPSVHPRLANVQDIAQHFDTVLPVHIHDSFQSILDQLEYPLLVCGTFFIMSEVRSALNIVEPQDEVYLNEGCMDCKNIKDGESSRLIH